MCIEYNFGADITDHTKHASRVLLVLPFLQCVYWRWAIITIKTKSHLTLISPSVVSCKCHITSTALNLNTE